VAKTLNFEEHIFSEFEELCKEENIYPSHKLQKLMIGELEKKVVGNPNPLNVSYGKAEEKPLQTDLTQWIDQVHQAKDDSDMLNVFEGMGRNIMVTAKHYLAQNRRKRILSR